MNSDEVPKTDAHALHALLSQVVAEPAGNGLHTAWANALDAKSGTSLFAKRHGEVVALYNRSVEQIEMLPSSTRANYRQWVPIWWRAVITPDMKWDYGLPGPVIDTVHLSLLHTLGDVVHATFGGSPISPGGGHLDRLKAAVETWVEELSDPVVLPNQSLRLSLIESLNHVLWLIENRTLFGDAPVARAAQEVVGAVALAAPHVPAEKVKTWKQRAVELAAAIAIFNGIVVGGQTAIEGTAEVIATAIEAGEHIADAASDE